jgi:hypothetical protein
MSSYVAPPFVWYENTINGILENSKSLKTEKYYSQLILNINIVEDIGSA